MIRRITTLVAAVALCAPALAAMQGPLRVHPQNPRYFTDGSGKAILLGGSHTWQNLQDSATTDPPPAFDYPEYLDFLESHGHNFFRLWAWEQSNWGNWLTGNWWISPSIHPRSGPGTALDGKPRFNVNSFNQAYFDRLRQRVVQARDREMYVSIMLFNGWSVESAKGPHDLENPWKGHPYNSRNNVNGINGDPNGDNSGKEIHTLAVAAVTDAQLAYVREVIDTVNDLDNVLYEISNESHADATAWQDFMVDYIKDYQATKPKQHPVGMTVEWPGGTNSELFASAADWISPNNSGDYLDDPPAADGGKVVISDTDHLCGVCGTRAWVWKSLTRGMNLLFMDEYDGKGTVGGNPDDPNWIEIRANLGYALGYARQMNLRAMTPRNSLASTGYCLANPAATLGEYLVYVPSGGSVTVDLSAADDNLDVEWLDPATGTKYAGAMVAGGGSRTLVAPFAGTDAVVYLEGRGLGGQPTGTPGEVARVIASKSTRVRIDWTAVPGATHYDVATGYVKNLRADKSYTRATCLANDVGTTWFEDSRGAPPRGDAHYYLVRANGATGSGPWGWTGAGVERTLQSACP